MSRSRSLRDSVVVVTGASSGIGRAAARMFADVGATVILAARREGALQQLARECREAGGVAEAVATDVRNETEVKALAERTVDRHERIDVWVNNAAVTAFGRFEDTPADVYDGVIQTNLFGYIHGARAAIPVFRKQGHGVLVNNASVVGYVGQPFTSAYVASKQAVRGWSECLRMETIDEPDIHVCTLLPASIDTPLFQHGANYMGRAAKPIEPVYPVEQAAAAMVRLAARPRREVVVGNAGRLAILQRALAPAFSEWTMARAVSSGHFQDRPAPPTPGNVREPMPRWTDASGGWPPARAADRSRVKSLSRGAALLAVAVPLAFMVFAGRAANGRSGTGLA